MRGSGHQTPHTEVELLQQQIDELKRRVDRIRNDTTPTVPLYDIEGNPPAVSIEGQIARGIDGDFWMFQNGEWVGIGPSSGTSLETVNDDSSIDVNPTTQLLIDGGLTLTNPSSGVAKLSARSANWRQAFHDPSDFTIPFYSIGGEYWYATTYANSVSAEFSSPNEWSIEGSVWAGDTQQPGMLITTTNVHLGLFEVLAHSSFHQNTATPDEPWKFRLNVYSWMYGTQVSSGITGWWLCNTTDELSPSLSSSWARQPFSGLYQDISAATIYKPTLSVVGSPPLFTGVTKFGFDAKLISPNNIISNDNSFSMGIWVQRIV